MATQNIRVGSARVDIKDMLNLVEGTTYNVENSGGPVVYLFEGDGDPDDDVGHHIPNGWDRDVTIVADPLYAWTRDGDTTLVVT